MTIRIILFLLSIFVEIDAQNMINGHVTDKRGTPLIGANVYIRGTIEGATTDTTGFFDFKTHKRGRIELVVNYMGYKEFQQTSDISQLSNLKIKLSEKAVSVDEVVITASNFDLGRDQGMKKMNALDIVMTGSSAGDIFAALKVLPGTQEVGDGRLYVRGGESDESQIFIDGMHVLMPYSTTSPNTPTRGRFSPFLFKGINFSLGGYDSEYGQALSSVLPMETKDVYPSDKLGVNFSPLNIGIGGTKNEGKGAFSLSTDYTNLGLYNIIFPDKNSWINPYQRISSEAQYKINFTPYNRLKFYLGHDYTSFCLNETDLDGGQVRDLSLKENNLFFNSTYKGVLHNDFILFAGMANSFVNKNINNAVVLGDRFNTHEDETHLKSYVKKSFTSFYKSKFGMEDYVRSYHEEYQKSFDITALNRKINYNLFSIFWDNQFRISKFIYSGVSSRLEHSSFNKQLNILPRVSITYSHNNLQMSGICGIYNQAPPDSIIAQNGKSLKQESAIHFIFSTSYQWKRLNLRAEFYCKKYQNLPLLNESTYNSLGYGYSKGIDLFLEDNTSIKNLRYTLSYSYNDSKRLYDNYPIFTQPQYVTKHNAAVSLRYRIPSMKTYVGISDIYASGRPYTDPNKQDFLSVRTSPYNSFDMNVTFLLRRNIILYTSVINLFNRNNVYDYTYTNKPDANNYYKAVPTTASRNRFFFIGIFITLKSKAAYDIANF